MILDKDNIIYSLNKYIDDLEKTVNFSIENKTDNFKEMYSCLGTVLFWIGGCLDRLNANGEQADDYEKAFRGAYNAQKHSVSIISFQDYKQGGMTFPFSTPLTIPSPRYCFEKLEEHVIKNDDQIDAYNKCLYKKDIVPEIKKIQEIIIRKMNKY